MKPGSILKRKERRDAYRPTLRAIGSDGYGDDPGPPPNQRQRIEFIAIKRDMSLTGMKWLLYGVRDGSLFCATEFWLKNEFEEIV